MCKKSTPKYSAGAWGSYWTVPFIGSQCKRCRREVYLGKDVHRNQIRKKWLIVYHLNLPLGVLCSSEGEKYRTALNFSTELAYTDISWADI